jgi:hypothetical protein
MDVVAEFFGRVLPRPATDRRPAAAGVTRAVKMGMPARRVALPKQKERLPYPQFS